MFVSQKLKKLMFPVIYIYVCAHHILCVCVCVCVRACVRV